MRVGGQKATESSDRDAVADTMIAKRGFLHRAKGKAVKCVEVDLCLLFIARLLTLSPPKI